MQRQQTGGRLKALIVLFVSLLVAGGATFLVFALLQRASSPRAQVNVVYALHDLPSAIPITIEDVRVFTVPRDAIPQNARFIPLADGLSESAETILAEDPSQPVPTFYTTVESVVGRTPRELILTREPVRAERLADPDKGIGLNAIIARGKRAMAVEVNAETGVAGLLQPGHQVDVLVSIQPADNDPQGDWRSFAFLQRVQVLAVDREIKKGIEAQADRQTKGKSGGSSVTGLLGPGGTSKRDARDKPTVTLEVTLEQAELLALAASRGEIHLALRNDQDDERVEIVPVTSTELLGLEIKQAKQVVSPARAPQLVYIDTKSGGNTIRSWYDEAGNKVKEQLISK